MNATQTTKHERAPRPSMRRAINEMCKNCIYDPLATGMGTWRQQVEACTSPGCPLYPLRPTSQPRAAKDPSGNSFSEAESGSFDDENE